MAVLESPAETLSEYTDHNYVKALFSFCSDVSSIEEFCTAAESVLRELRARSDAGWKYESQGDPHWFVLTHADREEAIRVLGLEYVQNEEKKFAEATKEE